MMNVLQAFKQQTVHHPNFSLRYHLANKFLSIYLTVFFIFEILGGTNPQLSQPEPCQSRAAKGSPEHAAWDILL